MQRLARSLSRSLAKLATKEAQLVASSQRVETAKASCHTLLAVLVQLSAPSKRSAYTRSLRTSAQARAPWM